MGLLQSAPVLSVFLKVPCSGGEGRHTAAHPGHLTECWVVKGCSASLKKSFPADCVTKLIYLGLWWISDGVPLISSCLLCTLICFPSWTLSLGELLGRFVLCFSGAPVGLVLPQLPPLPYSPPSCLLLGAPEHSLFLLPTEIMSKGPQGPRYMEGVRDGAQGKHWAHFQCLTRELSGGISVLSIIGLLFTSDSA